MKEDYNFGAFIHEGFECGLLYILRWAEEEHNQLLSDDDMKRLVEHLAEKKPWNSAEEWETLITNGK